MKNQDNTGDKAEECGPVHHWLDPRQMKCRCGLLTTVPFFARSASLGSPETPQPDSAEWWRTIAQQLGVEIFELKAAAEALIARMDVVHADPRYMSVWQINQMHVGPYAGPSYEPEMQRLRTAVTRTNPPPETPQEDAAPPPVVPPMHPRHPYDVEGSEYLPETCSREREHRSLICRECALIGIRRLTAPSLLAAPEGRVREALEHARTFCLDVRTAGDASGSRIRYNAIALTDELEAALAPLAEPPA